MTCDNTLQPGACFRMSEEPKVSVIVPVYRVERYLHQCVESLQQQTLRNIEIILVDDGSPDECPKMVDAYAAADSRVVAVHQPNGGYGKAVNHGLSVARGEYIGIVEPDDWVEADMYEHLCSIADQYAVQVVRSNYYKYTTARGDEQIELMPQGDVDQVIAPRKRSDIFYCRPTVWAALYRRDFLESNDIRMLESPGASFQDVAFNFKVLARAERMWLTPRPLVHYRSDNENSSTAAKDKTFCIFHEWDEVERYMDRYPEDKTASRSLRAHVKLDNCIWHLKRIAPENREEFRQRMAAEFRGLLKRRVLKPETFTRRKWMSIRRELAPGSLWVMLVALWLGLSGLILKPKVKNSKRCWYFLFGLIKVHESEIHRPGFYDPAV